MFFKARSQLFFGISDFFLIHHKLYPQDDHSLKFLVKKSWFSISFFTIFFYQLCWQIFLTSFFYKKIILNGHLEGNNYGEYFFFSKFEIFFRYGQKTIVLDVSWISSGLFSLKQVFWHLDFIVSSMHLDAILFWQIFSTNFIGDFFLRTFFTKK